MSPQLKKLNHRQLTLAREFRGLTQTQLSKMVDGLTQGNLSRAEKGLLDFTEKTISKIAEALNFPVSFFNDGYVNDSISSVYYRKRASLPKKTLYLIEARINLYCYLIDKLIAPLDLPDFNFPLFDLELGGTPEDAARSVRSFLRVNNGPIQNLVRLLEANGIIVIFLDVPTDKFDGLATITRSGQRVIFVNNSFPNDRKRFTLGHELAHLLMHIPYHVPLDRDEEKESNLFSAELNLPELEARKDLYDLSLKTLPDLKRYWKMSMAFLAKRAKDLDLITLSKYKYIVINMGKRGWRRQEPYHVDIDEPILLQQMKELHFKELGYTIDELAKNNNISKEDLLELLEMDRFENVVKMKVRF